MVCSKLNLYAQNQYFDLLTFYKYFTGKSVNTIPTNISTLDTNGQILYLIFMNDLDANFLRQLVNEFQFKTLPLKTEQIISPKK